jgi:hypothetical protein
VGTARIEVPVSAHPIDSINLKDPRLGVYAQLADFVKSAGVAKGGCGCRSTPPSGIQR